MPNLPPALPPPNLSFFCEATASTLRELTQDPPDGKIESGADESYGDYGDEDTFVNLEHLPPLNAFYDSLASLCDSLQLFAAANSFAIVARKSSIKHGTAKIGCVYGLQHWTGHGPNYSRIQQCPSSITYRCDCPFRLDAFDALRRRLSRAGMPEGSSGDPTRPWTFAVVDNSHNHPPVSNKHISILRQRSITPHIRQYITNAIDSRIRPAMILDKLARDHPSAILRPIDINNFTFRRRAELCMGHTSTKACINKLIDLNELHKPFLNSQQQLIGLVYTTPQACALLHRFPTVLFMDCTYKTNRYGLPMLHVAGFSSTDRTYTAAVAFLLRESTSWYDLALDAILKLTGASNLPIKVIITDREQALHHAVDHHLQNAYRLSCLWHLGENVKVNAKSSFNPQEGDPPDYNSVKARMAFYNAWRTHMVSAPTEAALKEGMEKLHAEYAHPRYHAAVSYVDGLLSMKEPFVHAWTDQHTHLNQTTTSRLEGYHHSLKSTLACSNGDLYLVIDALRTFLNGQWRDITAEIALQRLRRPVEARMFERVCPIHVYHRCCILMQAGRSRDWSLDARSRF